MTDCDLDFLSDTTGKTCTDVTEETCTGTDHQLLPPPPRKVPLRIRWTLPDESENKNVWTALIGVGLLLFWVVCLYSESGRLIDRHRAGWDAIEEQGTVETYRYVWWYAGIFLGYQCYEVDYAFQTPEGDRHEGKSYKHVHLLYDARLFRNDKSFQKGDIVPLEKYHYSNGIYRVMGTRAFPSNWLCFFFCFWATGLTWIVFRTKSKNNAILRYHEVTTAQLFQSETVEEKRQDSYKFIAGDEVITHTRTVLNPESEPVIDEQNIFFEPPEQIIFYEPSAPTNVKFLVDFNPKLKIENGRIELCTLNTSLWANVLFWGNSLFSIILYRLSEVMISLTIFAPYFPF